MIQQVFLSLISGLSILIGLDPHSAFYFFDKAGVGMDPGMESACWAGLINGLCLFYLKYRRSMSHKNLLVWLIIPPLFYQLFCSSFFSGLVSDLRVFSWIFIISSAACYFLIRMKGSAGKFLYPAVLLLSYAGQIPGFAGIALLILFLAANKIPVKNSILLVLTSFIPSFTASFISTGREFLDGSAGVDWLYVSLSYLTSCIAIFFSGEILFMLFSRQKEKVIINLSVGIGVALLFLTSRLGGDLSGEKAYHYTFPSMGTSCELTVWTSDIEGLEDSFKEVGALLESIEASLSTYRPDSEISVMNNTAHKSAFKCSETLWQNLLLAEYAHNVSNGGFDVTVGPLVKLWAVKKKRSKLPTKAEIGKALEIVGFDKLILDKNKKTVTFKRDGIKVDFGALTKGWAVDEAVKLLRSKGYLKFIVNLGGNLYCSQIPPKGKASYKIGIKNPADPARLCAKVDVLGQAVSTSGNYEQFIIIDGKRYTHIIDPRSGYPVGNVDAVTVISSSAALCDILSTSIFVEGDRLIKPLSEKMEGLSILFIDLERETSKRVFKNGIFENVGLQLYSK